MNSLAKRNNGDKNLPVTSFSGMVDRVLQDNLGRFFDDNFWGFNNRSTNVPVNVRETDKNYELELVAPGLKKEDFKINLNGELLTISYEQEQRNEQENKEEGWLRKEYARNTFSRSFQLDDTVDPAKIAAQYRDGILHVQLPKKEGAQKVSKTIQIT